MLFRYCCPLKSLNVLRIIANKQTKQTLVKMESASKITISGPLSTIESGLDFFLKSL